jgi:hypothetical protein
MARREPAGQARVCCRIDLILAAPQLVGCCEQGQRLPLLFEVPFLIDHVPDAKYTDLSAQWLRAYGVDALVVNGPASTDVYKDFEVPERFARVFPVLHQENGDIIYAVRPKSASLAHILHSGEPVAVGSPHVMQVAIAKYVEAIDDCAR